MTDSAKAEAQTTPNAEATPEKLEPIFEQDRKEAVKPEETKEEPKPEDKPEKEPEKEPTKEDPKPEEGKEEPAKKEDFNLKLPEDSKLGKEHVERTVAFAQEQGLSEKQAQALLDREASIAEELLTKNEEAQKEQYEALYDQWKGELEADKDYGGERLKETSEHAHRALKAFAPPELQQFLKESPYGNNPMLVKTFARIGKAMADDSLVRGGDAASERKSTADLIYSSSN